MRLALAVVAVAGVAACKHRSSAPAPARRDAAPVAVDWARCEQALRSAPTLEPNARLAALLDGCQVCGDWTPLLAWNTPQERGGPTREQIDAAMARCHGYCSHDARQKFLGTLDEARGTTSRAPWRWLGEVCKAEVSAVPDTRYMSAPYFALDRIARAVAARGGQDAALLAAVELPLPARSISGGGVELPAAGGPVDPAPRVHVTVLGDGAHVGKLPVAHLGAAGVTVDSGAAPYPGPAVAPGDLARAIAALDPSPHPEVAVLAPRGMPVARLAAALAKPGDAVLHLAVAPPPAAPDWPLPAVLRTPLDLRAGSGTVEDLARAK